MKDGDVKVRYDFLSTDKYVDANKDEMGRLCAQVRHPVVINDFVYYLEYVENINDLHLARVRLCRMDLKTGKNDMIKTFGTRVRSPFMVTACCNALIYLNGKNAYFVQ